MSEAKIVLTAEDKTGAAFSSAIAGLGKFHTAAEKVQGVLEAVGVTLSAEYFAELIKGSIEAASHLEDLHKSTDISVEDLAGLSLLAKQTGTDIDGLAKGVNRLSVEIGKTPDRFRALGITAKDGVGALKQFADIFNLLPDIQQRNALAQAVFNRSWAEMAPMLSKGSAGIQEAIDKGREFSGMTTAQAVAANEFNEKLALLTGTHGFLNSQVGSLLPLMNTLADDLVTLQGKAEGADNEFKPLAETLRAIVVVGGNVAFTFRGVGRELGALYAQANALGVSFSDIALGPTAVAAAIARSAVTGETSMAKFHAIHEEVQADAEKDRQAFDRWEQQIMSVGTSLAGVKTTIATMTDLQRAHLAAEQAAAAARARAFADGQAAAKAAKSDYDALTKSLGEQIAQQNLEIQGQAALTPAQKEATKIMEDLRTGVIHLTQAEAIRLGQLLSTVLTQETIIEQHKRETEAIRAAADAQRSYIDGLFSQATAAKDALQQQLEANAALGLSVNAVAALDAARLKDAADTAQIQAIKKLDRDGDEIAYNLTLDRVQALRDLADAKVTGAAKQTMLDDAKAAMEAWKKTNDEINRTLTDALMNAFDSGKGFGQAFVKTVEDMFKTMVLRPVISAIVSPVSSAIGGTVNSALGLGNAGSLASGASSLFGGGNVGGSLLSGANNLVSGAGSALGLTGLGADGLASSGATLIGETGLLGADSVAAAGLAAIPVVGWIALGALALGSIFGGKGGGPKSEGGYAPGGLNIAGLDIGGNMQGSQRGDVAGAQQIGQAISTGLAGLGQEFGISLAKDVGVFYAKDPQGTSQTQLNIVSDNYSRSATEGGIENVGRSDAELQAAIAKATAQLDLTELAKALAGKIGDYLQALDPKALTADQITADIQLAANAKELTDSFTTLGPVFKDVAAMSVEGLDNVATALGGMQAASASLTSYYTNFYTDAEKKVAIAQDISSKLANAGLSYTGDQVLAATREQFRQLEETLVGQGNAGAAEALLNVNAEFASIVTGATSVADATAVVVASSQELADALLPLGTLEARYAAQVNGIVQNNLQNSIDAAQQKVMDARTALTKAYDDESTALKGTIDSTGALIDRLRAANGAILTGPQSGLTAHEKYLAARQALSTATPDELPQTVGAYLDAAKRNFPGRLAYLRSTARADSALSDQEAIAGSKQGAAQLQLDAIKNLVSPLVDIKNAVLTIPEAMAQLFHAQFGLDIAKLNQSTFGMTQGEAAPSYDALIASAVSQGGGSLAGLDAYGGSFSDYVNSLPGPQPPSFASSAGGGEVVGAIGALTAEVKGLHARLAKIEQHTRSSADNWQRVTRNGNAMVTTSSA